MDKKPFEPTILPQLAAEYEKLIEAHHLLDGIWCRMNPYSGKIGEELPADLLTKLRNYFGFDDSE